MDEAVSEKNKRNLRTWGTGSTAAPPSWSLDRVFHGKPKSHIDRDRGGEYQRHAFIWETALEPEYLVPEHPPTFIQSAPRQTNNWP